MGEGSDLAQSAEKKLFVSLHFLAISVKLLVLVSALVMVSTVWCFLVGCVSTHGAPPPCPAICKSGEHVPPCPMESALLYVSNYNGLSRVRRVDVNMDYS